MSVFISASVVIAFLNYKAPSCITGSIISGQRREEKLAAQTITESESETTPSWWSRCWDTTVLYYRRISRLRSYIIITAVR